MTILPLPPSPSLADDLGEALEAFDAGLDQASEALGEIESLLDSARATRLVRRRGVVLDPEPLQMLAWLFLETCKQFWRLGDDVEPLLEAPRNNRTSYGVETGIYARTPYTGSCGTPGGYQQHRRRGQDCEPCRKAAARYEADRRHNHKPVTA